MSRKNEITSNIEFQDNQYDEIDSDIEIEKGVGPIFSFKFGEDSKGIKYKDLLNANLYTKNVLPKEAAKPNLRYIDFDKFTEPKIRCKRSSFPIQKRKEIDNLIYFNSQSFNKLHRGNSHIHTNSSKTKGKLYSSNNHINISIQKAKAKKKLLSKEIEKEYLRECTFSPKIFRSASQQKNRDGIRITTRASENGLLKIATNFHTKLNLNHSMTKRSSILSKSKFLDDQVRFKNKDKYGKFI